MTSPPLDTFRTPQKNGVESGTSSVKWPTLRDLPTTPAAPVRASARRLRRDVNSRRQTTKFIAEREFRQHPCGRVPLIFLSCLTVPCLLRPAVAAFQNLRLGANSAWVLSVWWLRVGRHPHERRAAVAGRLRLWTECALVQGVLPCQMEPHAHVRSIFPAAVAVPGGTVVGLDYRVAS